MRKLKLFLPLLMVMLLSLGNVWADDLTVDFESATSAYPDWTFSNFITQQTNSSVTAHGGSYFGTTGGKATGSLQTKNKVNPSSITFYYSKLTTNKTSSYWKVQVSTDGEDWTEVSQKSAAADVDKGKWYTYEEDLSTYSDVYVRIYYDGTTAVRCLDDVTLTLAASSCTKTVSVTKVTPTNGDFAISATEVCGDGDGGEVTISDIEPATGYAFDKITATNGTVDNENKKVTGITDDTEISVTFKELQKYTVSFNTGAGNPAVSPIEEATAGAGIDLPAGPTPTCSADGWIFAGWAAAAVGEETTTAPTLYDAGSKYNPTDDVTLYAVYKRTEEGGGVAFARYEKVASNPSDWSGKYLLAANTDGTTYYTFTGQNGSNNYGSSVEHTPGTTEKAEWEVVVAKTTNGYSIYHANSSKYLGLTASSNSLYFNANFTAETYEWVLSSANGAQAYSYDTRYIECNTGSSYRVACYAGTQKRFYLYKRIEEAASTTYYLSAPTCCTKHNVNIASGIENGSVTASPTQACEGTEVTLTANPAENYRFKSWSVNGGDVTVTDNKFTMPVSDVTVSATFELKDKVTIGVNDANMGSATVNDGAGPIYVDGDVLNLVATPKTGYEFVNWTSDNDEHVIFYNLNSATTTATVNADVTITANFQAPAYSITSVSANDDKFGTVSLDGFVITATPADGYRFADPAYTITGGTANVAQEGNIFTVSALTADCEITINFELIPSFTAKWFVNGEELTESTQTAVAGKDLKFPSDPTKLSDDCDDMIFKGWAEAPIDVIQDDAPAYTEKTKMPEDNVNFYAVFATEVPGKDVTIQDHITPTVVGKPSSYTYWSGKTATSNAVYAGNSTGGEEYIQIRSNEATSGVVSTTSGGKVTKIAVTWNNSTVNGRTLNVYGNNTAYESSTDLYSEDEGTLIGTIVCGTSTELTISDDYAYIGFRSNSGAMYLDEVVIDWKVPGEATYSNFLTTCPSCNEITFDKEGEGNGNTFELQVAGVAKESVKTCEDVSVNVVASPATGYELSSFAVSGVDDVTYSAGVITIPADAEGTLTATATFTKINYTVTMAQTGGAEATISGNQTVNYDDEITVTANEPEGYVFLGWEASPTVKFANATALETTFPMPNSNVTVTAKYAKLYTVAEALAKIPTSGDSYDNAVVEGYIKSVDDYSTSYKSLTYTLMDLDANGFETSTTIKVYSGKGIDNADFSSTSDLTVGAKVKVYGNLLYHSTGGQEINYNNYQLSYDEGTYDGVEIYGSATTTTYDAGDEFSTVGLNAKDVWDNGYAEAIPYASVEWKVSPATIAANTTSVAVTATYDNNTSEPYNVNVTVNTYAVTFEAPANGTLVVKNAGVAIASGDKFVMGTLLTVEATTEDVNYALTALTAGETDILADKQFVVGTSAVVVAATFAEKPEAPISWFADDATAYTKGKDYTLPTLTNESGLVVTYSSSNKDVASINSESGKINVKAAGTAVITATYTATAEGAYKTTDVSYTLTVVETSKVVINGTTNGSVVVKNGDDPIASNDYIEVGTELTIVATPKEGFKVNTIDVRADGSDNIDVSKEGVFTVTAAEFIEVTVTFTEVTTAVDNTEVGEKVVKSMENGVLIIRRGDKTYNGQGQLVK